MATGSCLKRGDLGDILHDGSGPEPVIVRALGAARPGWRWLARRLARREARALTRLAGIDGVPRLLAIDRNTLTRSFIAGRPLQAAGPPDPAWFGAALRLLRRLHRAGVAHNDLAKEANWLVGPDGGAGIVDFQLAVCVARRGRLFRLLAREDLRHLLKHKAHYCPDRLTCGQRRLLARPSAAARGWRRLVKPPYLLITRRLMGWPERHSAAERERAR